MVGRLGWAWIAIACTSACADDDDNAPIDASAIIDQYVITDDPVIDGDIVEPPINSRFGTIDVLAVSALQIDGPSGPSTGGLVHIEYGTPDVLPVYDDVVPVGVGCRVFVYGPGQAPGPVFDEGDVAIAGTLQALPVCSFDAEEYRCVDRTLAGAAGDSFAKIGPSNALTIAGGGFTANDIGMLAEVTGAADSANNGRFAILDVTDSSTAIIDNPNLVAGAADGVAIDVTAGHGPVGARVDFLEVGRTVEVSKTAGVENEAFSASVPPSAPAYRLDSASAQPHAIPLDGSEVTFRCTTGDGDCDLALGTEVTLEATNADVTGLPATALPPGTRSARARCMTFTEDLTVPAAAMTAFLGESPSDVTRVQTLVRRVNFAQRANFDGRNETVITVGYGHIGWTDR